MAEIVGGLVTAVVGCAGFLHKWGDSYYEVEYEWKHFPERVERLKGLSKEWNACMEDLGLDWSKERLIVSLEKAQRLLVEEETNLKKRMAKKQKKHLIKQLIFPAELGRTLNEVVKAFEDVLRILKERQEIRSVAEIEALNREDSLDFAEDKRYVRLQQTERAVRKALTQSEASGYRKLVLLHGASGQGKSSLARDIALQIDSLKRRGSEARFSGGSTQHNREHNLSTRASDSSTITPEESDSMQLGVSFKGVVFIECGPENKSSDAKEESKSLEVKKKLRQKLGWTSADSGKDEGEVDKSLEGLLQNKEILIILDDVWEPKLILEMLKPARTAPNVKFLITSQTSSLCYGLNAEHKWEGIAVERVGLTDARKILTNHIFRDQNFEDSSIRTIPDNIKGCADRIIQMVDRNLLAIACVGSASFDDTEFQDVKKWEEVEEELLGWVENESVVMIQDKCYPRGSYRAAMEFSISRLTADERRVLVLIILGRQGSTCYLEERTMGEAIVPYWYQLSKGTRPCQPFRNAIRTLKERQLVRQNLGAYSVHSLLESFVKDRYAEEHKDSTLAALSGNRQILMASVLERDFVSTVGNLYFEDAAFAERIAERVKATDHGQRHIEDRRVLFDAAWVMEPVLLLALKKVQSDWNAEMQAYARQVLLKFLYEGCLDVQGTKFLLTHSLSRKDMGLTVRNLRFCEENDQRRFDPVESILLPLMEVLTEPEEQLYNDFHVHNTDPVLLEVIVVIHDVMMSKSTPPLEHLNENEKFRAIATRVVQKFMERIAVSQLSQSKSVVSFDIVRCFMGLCPMVRTIRLDTEDVQGAVQGFVHAIAESQNPEFQNKAAETLAALTQNVGQGITSCGGPRSASSSSPGAVATPDGFGIFWKANETIVSLLQHDSGSYEVLTNMILGVMNGSRYHPGVEKNAAQKYAELINAGQPDSVKKVCKTPGSISALVDNMGKKDVRYFALSALKVLAEKAGEVFCEEFSKVRGAIQALVNATAAGEAVEIRKAATATLAVSSFCGDAGWCEKICKTQGSITYLVEGVGETNDPVLQCCAAFALTALAERGGWECRQILRENGARRALVQSVPKSENGRDPLQSNEPHTMDSLVEKFVFLRQRVAACAMHILDSSTEQDSHKVVPDKQSLSLKDFNAPDGEHVPIHHLYEEFTAAMKCVGDSQT